MVHDQQLHSLHSSQPLSQQLHHPTPLQLLAVPFLGTAPNTHSAPLAATEPAPLLVAWWASCASGVDSRHHVSAATIAFTPTIVSPPSSKPPPKATITARTAAVAVSAHVGEGDVLMPLVCTSGQAPVQCPPDERADVQRLRLRRHRRRQCLRRRESRRTTLPTTAATSTSFPYASRQPPTHCDQPPGRAPVVVSLPASSPSGTTISSTIPEVFPDSCDVEGTKALREHFINRGCSAQESAVTPDTLTAMASLSSPRTCCRPPPPRPPFLRRDRRQLGPLPPPRLGATLLNANASAATAAGRDCIDREFAMYAYSNADQWTHASCA